VTIGQAFVGWRRCQRVRWDEVARHLGCSCELLQKLCVGRYRGDDVFWLEKLRAFLATNPTRESLGLPPRSEKWRAYAARREANLPEPALRNRAGPVARRGGGEACCGARGRYAGHSRSTGFEFTGEGDLKWTAECSCSSSQHFRSGRVEPNTDGWAQGENFVGKPPVAEAFQQPAGDVRANRKNRPGLDWNASGPRRCPSHGHPPADPRCDLETIPQSCPSLLNAKSPGHPLPNRVVYTGRIGLRGWQGVHR